jgi:hypothetical protein
MTLNFSGRLTVVGCLFVLCVGCDEGTAGTGAGGAQGQIPGLWEGQPNGVDVCFYVGDDGRALTPSSMCNVTAPAESDAAARSFDISVDLVGTDQNGAPCSFELSFAGSVAIDPVINTFGASEIQGGAEIAFSGEITGERASGVARRDADGSICRVEWAATTSSECPDTAILSCLDLQDCCRAILINPVFFESCNSVVLQCDQAQCLEVLAGYPRCAPEPDAGVPDAG